MALFETDADITTPTTRFPSGQSIRFLTHLRSPLDDSVAESTEYQETLVGENEIEARLICWGVVGS
jgi:hypothetical protein